MDEDNGNNVMRFQSLNIKDCLGCKNVSVSFPQSNNVHVLLYLARAREQDGDATVAATPVAQAIQLLCTLTFPNAESLQQLPLLKVGHGSVSLRFQLLQIGAPSAPPEEDSESDLDLEPSTSEQAKRRDEERKMRREARSQKKANEIAKEVVVERRFDDPRCLNWVSYTVNGGERLNCALDEFHGLFFEVVPYSAIHLWDLQHKCAGNWLRIIQADVNSYKNFQTPDNPFETFAKLFERQHLQEGDLVCKLAKSCVTLNEAVRGSEREFVLQVFDHVRRIFEYITMKEYTVWFLVPSAQGPGELDFDLRNVRTTIRMTGDNRNIYWSQSDHNIQGLLMVSFQLALSSRAQQSVLIISHLDRLADFVSWQLITASYMNDIYARGPRDPKWVCMRYMQRIVEVAQSQGNIVLIEYPSFLSFLSDGRQVIKCAQQPDEQSWIVRVEADDTSSLEIFKTDLGMVFGSSH